LTEATAENIAAGKKWVEALETTGGTSINDVLQAALELQHGDRQRSFTIVFLTDGKPTIGETSTDRILANFDRKAKDNTRIFAFGVGYDLDAAFIDRLAEKHKGTSSYVRPNEDIEIKVSGFFNQIHQPVLTDLRLTTASGPRLSEIYPPQLPDLFHGGQLVVLGRYQGGGKATIRLTGQVGTMSKEFNYDVELQERPEGKPYVEDLWARRKVGYMLDQIRTSGEKRELVDEVIALAKRYGIATPYTSYLVVPDDVPHRMPGRPVPLSRDGRPGDAIRFGQPPATGSGGGFGGGGLGGRQGRSAAEALKSVRELGGADLARARNLEAGEKENSAGGKGPGGAAAAEYKFGALDEARRALSLGKLAEAQQNRTGVELSLTLNDLKNQAQIAINAQRLVQKRNCIEISGVWVDDQYKKDTPRMEIKAMSNAYFKLLERKPEMKEVLQLGNALVWIAPSGTAIVIDPSSGKEELSDEEIDRLFAAAK
jgi:Ca-activated chloride channel family protein